MSDNEMSYSKDLVLIINSIAAYIVIFILKFIYGALILKLINSEDVSTWLSVGVLGSILVPAICVGLFMRKEIARKAAIAVSVLCLLIFPFGTLVSIVFILCLIKNKNYYQ
ncbi:hypothetical protein GCM10008107_18980 [Psychrosphaera saromensis]|uniref:Uncharacterized protein n=1 Tax=Psychrosphaera saromensis TaxID=716813 RepID=A0A2S7UTK1_9GAMM|nr:hypothetical protein [Psychrosphaera saromensis]PQJ52611.1 hypothetical protein BTO11_02375 [Psychrosphaera saromensis]GHB69832.1 hypothetical protein GCM10008107_18980 [Psychrosphaera saromensis]GLQ13083.1 hypothetical protein GCM10007917_05380 [Psychrosphaera saromensis]